LRKETVEVIQFSEKCPDCGKKITDYSEKRLAYLVSNIDGWLIRRRR